MRVHFLGIAGTFMANLAILAKQLEFKVTGQDLNIYPPMSNQLLDANINYIEGYSVNDLPRRVDLILVGNVMRRGMPIIEYILSNDLPIISGPEFLKKFILSKQHNLVVTGTHGKTTTASILAWILENAGLNPGYLIGGVVKNFTHSANIGRGKFFVIEGDEYDCAFFDKRSKFIHYNPKTLIINNIEFDHADIFQNLNAIIAQFHHLLRIVPSNGTVIYNEKDLNINKLLSMGCWSKLQAFNIDCEKHHPNYNLVQILKAILPLYGMHNLSNALAASLAAINIGVDLKNIEKALTSFRGVARRLEYKGCHRGVSVYDDFAHHPTAIKETIDALNMLIANKHNQQSTDNKIINKVKQKIQNSIIAIVDLGSNTLKMGVNNQHLIKALGKASKLYLYVDLNKVSWDVNKFFQEINKPGKVCGSVVDLLNTLESELQEHDHVLIMSNGGLATVGDQLTERLLGK